jgi:hypothetical protein
VHATHAPQDNDKLLLRLKVVTDQHADLKGKAADWERTANQAQAESAALREQLQRAKEVGMTATRLLLCRVLHWRGVPGRRM